MSSKSWSHQKPCSAASSCAYWSPKFQSFHSSSARFWVPLFSRTLWSLLLWQCEERSARKWRLSSTFRRRFVWEFFRCCRSLKRTPSTHFYCKFFIFSKNLLLDVIFDRILGTIFWIFKSLDYVYLKRFTRVLLLQSVLMFVGGLFFLYLVVNFSNNIEIGFYQQLFAWILCKFSWFILFGF